MILMHWNGSYWRARKDRKVDGRYKIVQKMEKAKSHLAYVLEDWDKLIEPFQHVVWVKELGPGVKKLEVKSE